MLESNNNLVEEHAVFARALARRYFNSRIISGLNQEDFESAALYGLCDAATRFDGSGEAQFKTFAHRRIKGAMLDLVRKFAGIPRGRVNKNAKLDPADRIRQSGSVKELMFEAGVLLHLSEDHRVVGISYSAAESPEALVARKYLSGALQALVAELPEKERKVIEFKYYQDLSFEEMREHFDGATRSWICRIHAKALLRLRQRLQHSELALESRAA
jgi:RNA polymerase sigma factor for flagellar operon FliA